MRKSKRIMTLTLFVGTMTCIAWCVLTWQQVTAPSPRERMDYIVSSNMSWEEKARQISHVLVRGMKIEEVEAIFHNEDYAIDAEGICWLTYIYRDCRVWVSYNGEQEVIDTGVFLPRRERKRTVWDRIIWQIAALLEKARDKVTG